MNRTDQKKSVLIGSSGTGNAFSSILALRRNWGDSVKIIGIDSNPKNLVTSSLISDVFYQVPLIIKPEFIDKLAEIFLAEKIDTYIPLMDEEIYIASLMFEKGRFNEDLKLQVKSSKIADICNDKYLTFLFLNEINILNPESFKLDYSFKKYEGYILKPRKGFGSSVIKLSEIKKPLDQFNSEAYIIQDECEKPEITVDVCYDKNRNYFHHVCRERIETKSGVCTKARLFYDKELEVIAYKIADKLNLSSFCFQVMQYKGEWAVTDINARLGAGTGMSVAVNLDFFSGMFAILWGEDPSVYFTPLKKETYITRQYSDFIMNY